MATTPAAKGAISRKPLSPFNFKVRQSPIVHPSLPDNCTIFVTPDCPLPNVHTHTHTPPLAAVSRATQCTCSCTHLLSQQCLAPPNAHARKHTSSRSCVSRHPMHMLVNTPPLAAVSRATQCTCSSCPLHQRKNPTSQFAPTLCATRFTQGAFPTPRCGPKVISQNAVPQHLSGASSPTSHPLTCCIPRALSWHALDVLFPPTAAGPACRV